MVGSCFVMLYIYAGQVNANFVWHTGGFDGLCTICQIHQKNLGRTPPPFWQCQDFESAYSVNTSLSPFSHILLWMEVMTNVISTRSMQLQIQYTFIEETPHLKLFLSLYKMLKTSLNIWNLSNLNDKFQWTTLRFKLYFQTSLKYMKPFKFEWQVLTNNFKIQIVFEISYEPSTAIHKGWLSLIKGGWQWICKLLPKLKGKNPIFSKMTIDPWPWLLNPMFDLRPLSGFIPNIYGQTELYLISNIIHNVLLHSGTVELSEKV